jgi:MoaA/NifB/PqqE/SkfB family radical SAM enzyme
LSHGIDVEVYSNLVHIRPRLWETLARPGVRLATSYYSADPTRHEMVTGRLGSHARTTRNIIEALNRSIPLRVGIVNVHDALNVQQARAELESLGVVEIGVDRLRRVGRGARSGAALSIGQLCGNCASEVLAVASDGMVWPCVFARWLPMGNVREKSLRAVVASSCYRGVRDELADSFRDRTSNLATCEPKCEPYTAGCHPDCNPACSPRCDPVSCRPNCLPPRR